MKKHSYTSNLTWTGNSGSGTSKYNAYKRDHIISIPGKPEIEGSSDPSFRGDPTRYNPEELLVMSLSSCHMLWYLHLCAVNEIVVKEYTDQALGTMVETQDGSGVFEEVTLNPIVIISSTSSKEKALTLHEEANKKCFIANSVNFPVKHLPKIRIG